MTKRILQIILLISVIVFITSYFFKDQLPEKDEIDQRLFQEPRQEGTNKESFEKEAEGVVYTIKPLANYELHGLVVTYHDSNSWWDYYHKEWSDYINKKDVCVIWNKNIDTEVYNQMKFESGSWTCYFEGKYGANEDLKSKFSYSHLSNNHLLADNDEISNKIMEAKTGDQIYFKGYLAEYSHNNGQFMRGTSITRSDKGNRACETVYVTDFEIIRSQNDIWREIYKYSKYSIIGSLVLLILNLFRSPLRRKRRKKKK